jgi:DNA ligase D-like protein (predicted polymerase)
VAKFIAPMLPTLVDAPPDGEDWLHEIKHDGYRTQIVIAGGSVRAFAPDGEDWSGRCGPLIDAVAALGLPDAVIDGEMIVQDPQGRSDFSALQVAIAREPERLVLMAFDLPHLAGRDLRSSPLEERRGRLEELLGEADPARPVQFSAHVEGGGAAFFAAVDAMGLEGVVSKTRGSRYRSGYSKCWLTAKTRGHVATAAVSERPEAVPEGPKPIAGTAAKGGEPSYKKPRLPEKRAIVDYYRQMAPLVLNSAGRRPLNLFRCTAGYCFFQRNRNHPASGGAFQPPIRFLPIAQKNGRTEDYLWIADEAGVVACAEADAVEFHGWGALVDAVERPDRIAFDLDPGEGTGFAEVKAAALTMRRVLDEIGLASFPMLSGGKGIHVIVPLVPRADWAEVRSFAHRLCAALAAAGPERFTVALPKAERTGRIFLDFLRNQRTATAVLPYSLRARAGAPVAAPVTWDELSDIGRASRFTIADATLLLRRARSRALRGWGQAEQELPALG